MFFAYIMTLFWTMNIVLINEIALKLHISTGSFEAISEGIIEIFFSGKILSVNVNEILIELKFLRQDR